MILSEIAKDHNYWLSIARKLVGDDAEDLVQDMYVRIHDKKITLQDIAYKHEINKYFIYRTLYNLCIDHIRKKSRMYKVDIDKIPISSEEKYDNGLDLIFERMYEVSKNWDSHERKLFNIYMFSGLSLRGIADGIEKSKVHNIKEIKAEAARRGSGLSVSHLFHTIKRCRESLINEMSEDYEDYKNKDYERI